MNQGLNLNISNIHVQDKIVDIIQWITIFSLFFMNRVAAIILLFAVIFLVFHKKRLHQSSLVLPIIFISIFQITLIEFLNYDVSKCIQQIIIITIFVLAYEQIFKISKETKPILFYKYVKLSYYFALLGLMQVVVYFFVGINICEILPGNHLSQQINAKLIRATSTLSEGGYLGTILVPSLIYLFYYNDPMNILGKKKYIVLLSSAFTISPFVYLLYVFIPLTKLYKLFSSVKYIMAGFIGVFLIMTFLNISNQESEQESRGVDGIFMRITDTWKLLSSMSSERALELSQYNTSTGVLGTSVYIAFNAPSRILGTGLGTQEQNYNLVTGNILSGNESFAELNKDDGYSLSLRIMSEWGYVGFLIYILFLISFFNKENKVNICVLFILLCFFIRGGSYVDWGVPFWHMLYFYTSKTQVVKLRMFK